jgi:hypothetical protein
MPDYHDGRPIGGFSRVWRGSRGDVSPGSRRSASDAGHDLAAVAVAGQPGESFGGRRLQQGGRRKKAPEGGLTRPIALAPHCFSAASSRPRQPGSRQRASGRLLRQRRAFLGLSWSAAPVGSSRGRGRPTRRTEAERRVGQASCRGDAARHAAADKPGKQGLLERCGMLRRVTAGSGPPFSLSLFSFLEVGLTCRNMPQSEENPEKQGISVAACRAACHPNMPQRPGRHAAGTAGRLPCRVLPTLGSRRRAETASTSKGVPRLVVLSPPAPVGVPRE